MNQIVNKFSLEGDKFMPEMHLKQPRSTYSACGPFTKNKKQMQKFKETGDTSYIYKKELDKACFQHDMAYEDFKELARRTTSDAILRDKAFNIAKNMMDIKEDLLLWFINFLIKIPLYLQIYLYQGVVLLIVIIIIIIIITILTGRFSTTFTANWQNWYRKFGSFSTLADLLPGLADLLPPDFHWQICYRIK